MYALELEGYSVASYKTIYFRSGFREHTCRPGGCIQNMQHEAAPAGHTWYEVWYGGRHGSADVELFSAPNYDEAVKHFLGLCKTMDGRAFHKGTGRIKCNEDREGMSLDKFIDYWENIVMAA